MAGSRCVCRGLFNVEYLTVLTLFILFSTYFTFRMMEQKPAYIREVRTEIFRSESYRLSEMLVNDAGAPANWQTLVGTADEGSIRRIGLSDESENVTNLLSEVKIANMSQMCAADYAAVKRLVGAQHDFSLVRIGLDGVPETICSPGAVGDVKASITRLVAFGGEDYGKMVVQMW
ncbi:MAG: hypothetical protein ABIA12_01190 [Candidatus Aenigmatarchaeota archaeon]